jgi:hypothetical protein
VSASKDIFIQGETATFTVADNGYAAVHLAYGSKSADMTKADGVWTAAISTASLSGRVNYAIFADGVVVSSGCFVVRLLVSQYRAAVAAIDAAMQKVGANGKYSISVGEINLTDKTFDEMMKWRGYYESLADAQESGGVATIGPYRTEVALQ